MPILSDRMTLKEAFLAALGIGVPIVLASLLLLGLFAYPLFPTLLSSLILSPVNPVLFGGNLALVVIVLRSKPPDGGRRRRWQSIALAALGSYLAFHAFLTFFFSRLGL